jgi:S-adenosylmethionine:tRNA ribosyltransferase-isomerase
MHLDDFYYQLPEELIAQTPAQERDSSRLMVIHRDSGKIEHRFFHHLGEYLGPGDILVVNDTKVRSARLLGSKETGGKVELLLLAPLSACCLPRRTQVWEALVHARKKPRVGAWIYLGPQLKAQVLRRTKDGVWHILLEPNGNVEDIVQEIGHTPLPPYIKRSSPPEQTFDRRRYQTIFAQKSGSAAAPTAGLHFTEQLIDRLKENGVTVLAVTLHVGLGTFQPVRAESIEHHRMHREFYEVAPETATRLREAFQQTERRIIACGTTSVRVLETLKRHSKPLRGYTDLFIYPGYRFETIQGMITNFHLPRSTLLMLVAAFAGKDLILEAYQEAIERTYRFYSYGDAMLIL